MGVGPPNHQSWACPHTTAGRDTREQAACRQKRKGTFQPGKSFSCAPLPLLDASGVRQREVSICCCKYARTTWLQAAPAAEVGGGGHEAEGTLVFAEGDLISDEKSRAEECVAKRAIEGKTAASEEEEMSSQDAREQH